MLRNRLLFFSLLFCCGRVFGQDTTAPNKLTALFSVAAVSIHNIELAVQPGLQWRLRHWSLAANTTFLLQQPHDRFSYVHYWRNSLDIKRYLNSDPKNEPYMGLAMSYALRIFNDTAGVFFKLNRTDRYSYAKARIHTPLATFVIKAGDELQLGKRLSIDAFGGIGVRIAYTTYQNLENEMPHPYGLFGHVGPLSAYRYDKTVTRLHVTGGVRLGYALW